MLTIEFDRDLIGIDSTNLEDVAAVTDHLLSRPGIHAKALQRCERLGTRNGPIYWSNLEIADLADANLDYGFYDEFKAYVRSCIEELQEERQFTVCYDEGLNLLEEKTNDGFDVRPIN